MHCDRCCSKRALSDLLLSTFIARREALQQVEGVGFPRSSARVRRRPRDADRRSLLGTACPLLGATQRSGTRRQPRWSKGRHHRVAGRAGRHGASRLLAPARTSRALGIGRELAPREEVDLVVVGGGPAGLGAAVYGRPGGFETLVAESTALGGQAGSSRRIENYLGFPAGSAARS